MPFRGQLLVERGFALLRDGGCRPVVIVLGAEAEAVRRRARLPGAEIAVNTDWASGMASSVRVGLSALAGRCDAAIIALADQPLVGTAAVERLIAAHASGARAVVATYGGRPRNPVLLHTSVWGEALSRTHGDVGVRALLRARPDAVCHVECDDTGSPADVDTPEDLAALERPAGSPPNP